MVAEAAQKTLASFKAKRYHLVVPVPPLPTEPRKHNRHSRALRPHRP